MNEPVAPENKQVNAFNRVMLAALSGIFAVRDHDGKGTKILAGLFKR